MASILKKIITVMVIPLLIGLLGLTAYAEEGTDPGNGFYMEELPEFGQVNEIVFTDPDSSPSELVTESNTGPAAPEEVTTSEESQPETQPALAEITTDPAEDASPAAPETKTEASGNNNLPAMIAAAALAIGAAAIYLIKKHKHVEPHRGDGK